MSHWWCLFLRSETKIWREKERSRFRAIQMDNLRGPLGIRRMDKVSNARIRQLCGLTKGGDEKIDAVLRWPFGEDGERQDC